MQEINTVLHRREWTDGVGKTFIVPRASKAKT